MSSPSHILNSLSSRYKDFCQTNDDNRDTGRAGIDHIPGHYSIMSLSNSQAEGEWRSEIEVLLWQTRMRLP